MTKDEEEAKKKEPKTVLNAATWVVHMGVNSDLRYQTLNAVEFLISKAMPVGVFKATVVLLRCLNVLVAMTKEEKEAKKKKGPKTVLNAATWAVHMGVSSNLRYQTLNAVEFLMAKAMPVGVFKAMVVVLRYLNNVAGGMSFVLPRRLMGSQKVEEEEVVKVE